MRQRRRFRQQTICRKIEPHTRWHARRTAYSSERQTIQIQWKQFTDHLNYLLMDWLRRGIDRYLCSKNNRCSAK